jgi:hypothetical protein
MICAICPYCGSVKCIIFDDNIAKECAKYGHSKTKCDKCTRDIIIYDNISNTQKARGINRESHSSD